MEIHLTARHFKAHETLRNYAQDSLSKLDRFYKGIISVSMVLSFEKAVNSVKVAELHITVHGTVLKSLVKSDDFIKSIDLAVNKAEKQLLKFKSKQREKKKIIIRTTKEKE